MFTKAWQVRGGTQANTEALRSHLKDNGLIMDAGGILGELADFKHSVGESLGSVFKVGGTFVFVFVGFGVLFAGALIWRIVTPENVGVIAGTAAKTVV